MKVFKSVIILFIFTSCYSPKEKPEDFDEFWERTLSELGPIVSAEVVKDSTAKNKKWTLNKIQSYNDIHFYAWVSEPLVDAKYPIKIKFSGFGRGNTSVNNIPHKEFLRDKGTIGMVVDIRGQGISTEQIGFNGYLTNGLKNKNDYIYRGAFMDAVKSVDFIAEHPKSDGNIITTGENQGGALSIVAAALNPKVTMSIIGFPFFTDMYNYNRQKWPMKVFIHESYKEEIDLDDLLKTLSYFDMINFAEKMDAPLFLRTQEFDNITPKEGAIKFFNKINHNNKNLYIEPCSGHGCSLKSLVGNKKERMFIKNNLKIKDN